MRVLMISLDRGLLGAQGSGDAAARHQKYANLAGELDIIVFASQKYSNKILSENLRVFPTRSSKFAHFHRAVEIAKKLISEKSYDLLVTQEFTSPVGLKIKKFADTPWIINIHSMFFSSQWLGFNPIYWYMFFLMKKAMRSADGFRVTNDLIRQKLVDWGVQKPILVQPTPVDIEKFKVKNEKLKIENENPRVLYVGRLEAEKNVALLIRAFRRIKDRAELLIVGSGSQERDLKRLAAEDLRVKFFGSAASEELPEIYHSADIFVLPSNTESFGKVLVEAGASGCALVATASAGSRSILEADESGVLVPVNDESALSRAMQSLVSKKFEREYWGQRAREMSKKYNAETATQRIIDLWREVAERKKS